MWGDDTLSDLGDNSQVSKPVPQVVTGLSTTARSVAMGQSHTLSLLSDQTLWSWGNNSSGQLGLGTTVNRATPVQVLTGISAIGAGANHSLAIMSGQVLTWGLNGNGQLGNNSTTNLSTPAAVAGLFNIVAVAGGTSHSLALDANGNVSAWGLNSSGQVGDGTTTQRTSQVTLTSFGGPITAIAAGSNFNLALKNDQTVWAWGNNAYGQIGNGTTANQMTPVQVPGLSGITAIAVGTSHAVALKSDGSVWTWGYDNAGQLGNGTYTSSSTPTQVPGAVGSIAVAAEASSTLVLKQDGTLSSWGFSNNGELAIGIKTAHSTPAPVDGLNLLSASPTLALTSPTPNSTGTINQPISLTVNAATPSGSISQVNYYNEGTLIASSNTAPFSASFTPTTWGTFNLNAVATDSQGFASLRTPVASVTVPYVVVPPTVPAAPAISSVVQNTDGSVTISWSPVAGASSYTVETVSNVGLAAANGAASTTTNVITLDANATSYVLSADQIGSPGSTGVTVVATNSIGSSSPGTSPSGSTAPLPAPVNPIPIQNCAVIDLSGSVQGSNNVIVMALGDNNQAAFGYWANNNDSMIGLWKNGVLTPPKKTGGVAVGQTGTSTLNQNSATLFQNGYFFINSSGSMAASWMSTDGLSFVTGWAWGQTTAPNYLGQDQLFKYFGGGCYGITENNYIEYNGEFLMLFPLGTTLQNPMPNTGDFTLSLDMAFSGPSTYPSGFSFLTFSLNGHELVHQFTYPTGGSVNPTVSLGISASPNSFTLTPIPTTTSVDYGDYVLMSINDSDHAVYALPSANVTPIYYQGGATGQISDLVLHKFSSEVSLNICQLSNAAPALLYGSVLEGSVEGKPTTETLLTDTSTGTKSNSWPLSILRTSDAWKNLSVSVNSGGLMAGYATPVLDSSAKPIPVAQQISHAVLLLPIELDLVNRDNLTQTWTANEQKQSGLVTVYAGTTTGDEAAWRFNAPSSWQSGTFTWTATDSQGNVINGPSGVDVDHWQISDTGGNDPSGNTSLTWKPDTYTIKCNITFSGSETIPVQFTQKVGWRTEDYVVIGQIVNTMTFNNSGPATTIDSTLFRTAIATDCSGVFALGAGLSGGLSSLISTALPDSAFGLIEFSSWGAWPHSLTPEGPLLYAGAVTEGDRYWMLENALNDSVDTPTVASPENPPMTATQISAIQSSGQYRIFHHYQTRFTLTSSGKIDATSFHDIHNDAIPGTTKFVIPEGAFSPVWPDSPQMPLPYSADSQASPYEGHTQTSTDGTSHSGYASNRIAMDGQNVNWHVFGQDVPWIYSEIICKVASDHSVSSNIKMSVNTDWLDSGTVVGNVNFNNLNIYKGVFTPAKNSLNYVSLELLPMEGQLQSFILSVPYGTWPTPPTTPSVQ